MISGLSETAGERTDNPVLGKAAGMDMGVLDEGTGGGRVPLSRILGDIFPQIFFCVIILFKSQ